MYVYKRTGSNWAQEAYIKTPTTEHRGFGVAVSLDNNTLTAGAFYDYSDQRTISIGASTATNTNYPESSEAGAIYIFSRSGDEWTQHAYIKSSNLDANDFFGGHGGKGVSVDGDTVVVGAIGEDSNQTTITNGSTSSANNSSSSSGAVYVYLRE